jgi:hypothetical protein
MGTHIAENFVFNLYFGLFGSVLRGFLPIAFICGLTFAGLICLVLYVYCGETFFRRRLCGF